MTVKINQLEIENVKRIKAVGRWLSRSARQMRVSR